MTTTETGYYYQIQRWNGYGWEAISHLNYTSDRQERAEQRAKDFYMTTGQTTRVMQIIDTPIRVFGKCPV